MKKYRIIKHTYNHAEFIPKEGRVVPVEHTCYEVQKRFLGFLWWYNFNNIDGITTGIYDQLWEAEAAIEDRITNKHKKEVVEEYGVYE